MSDVFTQGVPAVNGRTIKLSVAAAAQVVIPKGAVVDRIYIRNKTANAVTGGVKVGTTAGGTDVLAAGAVAANDRVSLAPLVGAVNINANRTLFFDAVTSWNSAVIDIAVKYTYVG